MCPDAGIPAPVLALAGGEAVRPVWVNELGGITFEIGAGGRRRFVKWAPAGSGLDLAAEAARLAWAVAFTPVPRLLGQGADGTGSWLVTSALAGEMAVTARWKAEPYTAVAAIGAGLRAMHEALPVAGCPFSWSAADRLADAHRRAARGQLDPARWHPCHQALSVAAALELLADAPPVDELVVCHGDSCAPNTLLTGDGRCSGHVDLVSWAWPTAGPTWPSPPGALPGTMAPAGKPRYWTPTASPRTRSAPATTACSGTWARDRRRGDQAAAVRQRRTGR